MGRTLGNNIYPKNIFDSILFDKIGLFPNEKLDKFVLFSDCSLWKRKFYFVWVKQ